MITRYCKCEVFFKVPKQWPLLCRVNFIYADAHWQCTFQRPPDKYCKITLERKVLVLRIWARFVAECLFDASKIMFMLGNYHVTLKVTQKLVSFLFLVSIYIKLVRVALQNWLILHTPGPEIPDLAYHIHSFLTLLTQLFTLLRHMILQWFQPKWLSMDLCIHSKTILLILLRLLTCHYIKLSKVSNLSRGQNSCMNMPTHKHTSNIDIIWVYT